MKEILASLSIRTQEVSLFLPWLGRLIVTFPTVALYKSYEYVYTVVLYVHMYIWRNKGNFKNNAMLVRYSEISNEIVRVGYSTLQFKHY